MGLLQTGETRSDVVKTGAGLACAARQKIGGKNLRDHGYGDVKQDDPNKSTAITLFYSVPSATNIMV
jgi:hypothetical protein